MHAVSSNEQEPSAVMDAAHQLIDLGYKVRAGQDSWDKYGHEFLPSYMADRTDRNVLRATTSKAEVDNWWHAWPWLTLAVVLDHLAVMVVRGPEGVHDMYLDKYESILAGTPCAWFPSLGRRSYRRSYTMKYFFSFDPDTDDFTPQINLGWGADLITGSATVVPPSDEGEWDLSLLEYEPLAMPDVFSANQAEMDAKEEREEYLETKTPIELLILDLHGEFTTGYIKKLCMTSGHGARTVGDALERLKLAGDITKLGHGRWLIP